MAPPGWPSARSAIVVEVVEVVGHREGTAHPADSNLLAERTSNGGTTWRAAVIALARG